MPLQHPEAIRFPSYLTLRSSHVYARSYGMHSTAKSLPLTSGHSCFRAFASRQTDGTQTLGQRSLLGSPIKGLGIGLCRGNRDVHYAKCRGHGDFLSQTESDLFDRISIIPDAVFPAPADLSNGNDDGRSQIMGLLSQIEEGYSKEAGGSSSMEKGERRALLSGTWRLLFAGSGTVVTRSAFGSFLRQLSSSVSGFGIDDICQTLEDDGISEDSLQILNRASIGVGPFGEWRLQIKGTSTFEEDGNLTASIKFHQIDICLTKFLGRSVAQGPRFTFDVNNDRSAVFHTTYCSPHMRIARGSTGNVFVFRKDS